MEYKQFLSSKAIRFQSYGVDVEKSAINPMLFEFQKDMVKWALRKGRAAIFADTGLGKTFMQVEWARLTGVKVLIVAPLSVAKQTRREAQSIYYGLASQPAQRVVETLHSIYCPERC